MMIRKRLTLRDVKEKRVRLKEKCRATSKARRLFSTLSLFPGMTFFVGLFEVGDGQECVVF